MSDRERPEQSTDSHPSSGTMRAHAPVTPMPSHPPATPMVAEAISEVVKVMAYHDKRMGKRLRRLRGEAALFGDDELPTGVFSLPDPFPPMRRKA